MKTKTTKKQSRKVQHGWVADSPDFRDKIFKTTKKAAQLPIVVDLRNQCPSVYDQSTLGSCTANSIGGAIQFEQMKQKKAVVFNPSRLFIYYNERVIENSVNSDSGAQIRDGIKSVNKQGVCDEKDWIYDVKKFRVKPTKPCYDFALNNQVLSYHRVPQTLNQMKGCLAQGFPFVFGFTCYDSFESNAVAKTGILPMPQKSEKVVGGHAVLCVGYDDTKQVFIIRNSWGNKWGQKGYFTMPYEYLLNSNLSDDFWTIRIVE